MAMPERRREVDRLASGWTVRAVAAAHGLDPRTVRKWPRPLRRRGARRSLVAIARRLGRPVSTVGRILRRYGPGRRRALEPPVIRYQRRRPGERVHLDTNRLGRINGIGHRIAGDRRNQGLTRRRCFEARRHRGSCRRDRDTAFPDRAPDGFERLGVGVERVITDNGAADRSKLVQGGLAERGIRPLRTRPYTPRTNRKAERFIQTSLCE